MATCEKISKCPFFNDTLENMPGVSTMLKKKYCQADPESCARFQVAQNLGAQRVPSTLFPHQLERLPDILGH